MDDAVGERSIQSISRRGREDATLTSSCSTDGKNLQHLLVYANARSFIKLYSKMYLLPQQLSSIPPNPKTFKPLPNPFHESVSSPRLLPIDSTKNALALSIFWYITDSARMSVSESNEEKIELQTMLRLFVFAAQKVRPARPDSSCLVRTDKTHLSFNSLYSSTLSSLLGTTSTCLLLPLPLPRHHPRLATPSNRPTPSSPTFPSAPAAPPSNISVTNLSPSPHPSPPKPPFSPSTLASRARFPNEREASRKAEHR